MKRTAKKIIIKILGWQVRRLQKRHDIIVVAVAGSVGKTTTKHVIANYLGSAKHVHYQTGNYNVPLTVPLVFFDEETPSLSNPFAWLSLFVRNENKIRDHYPYEIVVVELGVDSVGEMEQFKAYLNPNIAVLTSISPEHMEFFKDLDEVAAEELNVLSFSRQAVIGIDDIPQKYIPAGQKIVTYGLSPQADYRCISRQNNVIIKTRQHSIQTTTQFVGVHVQKSLAAAVAVSEQLGIDVENPGEVLSTIGPMPGRMQVFEGRNGSVLIDDTYNNVSPVPMKAAIDVLNSWPSKRRIAVIGNMNELGAFSEASHREVGAYCDPKKLDLVITIGPHAGTVLADAAEANGCTVLRFDSPYKIGEYLKKELKEGDIVLLKGSQNRVFLEEAVKLLLINTKDRNKLVRQSPQWLKKKERQFKAS